MSDTLKSKTITGMIWSATEKFGYTILMFLANLALARILMPSDFGQIGMIMVFVAISNTLVDSGFALALINRKNTSSIDFSTVFYINVAISILFYLILYFAAPSIATFYEEKDLIIILRVVGTVLLFNAFSIVQVARFRKELNFRYLSKTSFFSTLFGCVIGIAVAYLGYGVWGLVAQILSMSVIKSIVLWLGSSWKPKVEFSFKSLKEMYEYGSMILLTTLIDVISKNLIALIIGKSFSPKVLGEYTLARSLEGVPNATLGAIVNQVTFPVYSMLQDDQEKMKRGIRKSLKSIAFLNFPLMIMLIIIAKPLIILLYTEKWVNSVFFFQVAGLGGMLVCVHQINQSIMLAMGKSKQRLRSGIVKKAVELSLIGLGIYLDGVRGMVLLGVAVSSYLSFFIHSYFTSKIFPYTTREQLVDLTPTFLLSIVAGIVPLCLGLVVTMNLTALMIIQGVLYLILYLGFASWFNFEAYNIYKKEAAPYLAKLLKTKRP